MVLRVVFFFFSLFGFFLFVSLFRLCKVADFF